MKKHLIVCAVMIGSVFTSSSLQAATGDGDPKETSSLASVVERMEEIRSMDISILTKEEKKALKAELKAMHKEVKNNFTTAENKAEMKEMKKELKEMSNGVYLSTGAIIIILLILILIL
ncbi:hypothetical protein [Penaeicola halotolerans]|uniref:hypothetical protein n=1 Tax=Penaeicola halotolerans TaxID=2793196 RepID=UPI001CF8A329|nr:hypothetical protein [Penaeicola halotolerans]